MSRSITTKSPVLPQEIVCVIDKDGDIVTSDPGPSTKDAFKTRAAYREAGVTGIRIVRYKFVEEVL